MEGEKLREEIIIVQEWESLGKANGPGKRRGGGGINLVHLPALGCRPKEDANHLQRTVKIRELFDSIYLSNGGGVWGKLLGTGALAA